VVLSIVTIEVKLLSYKIIGFGRCCRSATQTGWKALPSNLASNAISTAERPSCGRLP
jgi:hypothetical protein